MRRSEKEIRDRREIDSIIIRSRVCRLAMCCDGQPYIVPLCFGYDGNALYIHAAKEGMKIDALRINSRVCFEMDIDQELVRRGNSCSMRYRSVIGNGQAVFIEDVEEKRLALEELMSHYGEAPVEWSREALAKVAIIKIEIDSLTGKISNP
jgi:uncharacterized protein